MKPLTDREREVARLAHKSNGEIGAALGISHNTVKLHLNRVYWKMGLDTKDCRAILVASVKRGEV